MTAIGMIIFGAWFSLIGFGKAAITKNAEKNEKWMAKYGKFYRIAGPVLVGCGIILIFLE